MKLGFIGSMAAGAMLVAAVAHGQGHDVSVRFALDPDSSDDSPLTTVVSAGYRVSDETTFGLYGSFQTADRELPANMEYVLGAGVCGEFGPDAPDLPVLPYAGASVGFLDPSGVGWQTMVHLQGCLGARFPLQSGWMLNTSVALHWADDEFFDAEADRRGNVSADDTDITFDVGVLRRF